MSLVKNTALLLLFGSISLLLNAQVSLQLTDPLEPIYPDSNQLTDYNKSLTIDYPSGTVADVNLLLNVPVTETFSVTASFKGKTIPISCWSQLMDVPVEQNTGLNSRTEMYSKKTNPYVIRRAPFRIYEVIQPLLTTNNIAAKNRFTALRLSIPGNTFPKAGSYKIKISVQGNGWIQKGVFTVNIHKANIPRLQNSNFFYTNWFNLSQMEQKHQLTRWTPEWFSMLNKYAALLAQGRQNCINIPSELLSYTDNRITLNEEKLYRFTEVFRQHGFRYFESPHLMYRGDNDNWGDPELKVHLTKRGYNSDAGKRDVDTLVRLIKNFTEKYGLINNWLQHISDEPTKVQAACYRAVVKQVKAIYPEIKIMEATNDRDSLVSAIDFWCPLINDFQENENFFLERVKQHEKVMVYTCLIPGGKWLNRTLDQERLRQVYFGWGAAKYNTYGFLHWGLNQYHADPFKQSVVHHPAPGAGANNFLPAGDTHIIYPGDYGPLSSVRFEAHRIGIEDYELLEQLKQKSNDLYEKLMQQIFRSYTDYDISVKNYRAAKKMLLSNL